MNNKKIEQNTERAYRYLKGLGCNNNDINKIASELIIYNSNESTAQLDTKETKTPDLHVKSTAQQ